MSNDVPTAARSRSTTPHGPIDPSEFLSTLPSAAVVMRVVGLVVMIFGLSVAYTVMEKAWQLFDDSSVLIVPLSDEIEQRTGVNRFAAAFAVPMLESMRRINSLKYGTTSLEVPSSTTPNAPDSKDALDDRNNSTVGAGVPEGEVRISYFVSWAITLLLLGIIARIGLALISVGAKLANETAQRKEIADLLRVFISEVRSTS